MEAHSNKQQHSHLGSVESMLNKASKFGVPAHPLQLCISITFPGGQCPYTFSVKQPQASPGEETVSILSGVLWNKSHCSWIPLLWAGLLGTNSHSQNGPEPPYLRPVLRNVGAEAHRPALHTPVGWRLLFSCSLTCLLTMLNFYWALWS